MLDCELRINGVLIKHYHIVNLTLQPFEPLEGYGPEHEEKPCEYRWQSYHVKDGKVLRGKALHYRSHGAELLIQRVMKAEEMYGSSNLRRSGKHAGDASGDGG